jgi:hypothetical protein
MHCFSVCEEDLVSNAVAASLLGLFGSS